MSHHPGYPLAKIEARVAALEKQNRRLRCQVRAMAIVAGAVALMAFKSDTTTTTLQADKIQAKEISTQRFIVLGTGSTEKASLQARKDGRQGLEIEDNAHRVLLRLPE